MLDLVQIHHEVLLEVLGDTSGDDISRVATAASDFLVQVLAIYDMAQRALDERP